MGNMRSKREVVVKLINDNKIYNHRLAEFFAKKYKEREIR